MKQHTKWIALMALLLSACAGVDSTEYKRSNYASHEFIQQNYQAADKLMAQLGNKLTFEQPIIMTTIVNMDALSKTSSFGRLVSEQVSARFSQGKYSMVEVKLRDNLLVEDNKGEFLLTRDLSKIAKNQNAQAVVVGTYAETESEVYVNLKVVEASTNAVLAGSSHAFPKAKNIRQMLIAP